LQNIGEIDSHTKVICTAFKCLQFGFVNFWRKDFGTKAAHKMLVKLTPCLQFFKGIRICSQNCSTSSLKKVVDAQSEAGRASHGQIDAGQMEQHIFVHF
jgi:hypothetical protein